MHELREVQALELKQAANGIREQMNKRLSALNRQTTKRRLDERQRGISLARSAMPRTLQKLTDGYEMRVFWFEIFECLRKIMLVGVPAAFRPGSSEQLLFGLLICFLSFGTYMAYHPFAKQSDDVVSQACQVQIFLSLLSSLVLKTQPNSPVISYTLSAMLFIPPLALTLETPLLDELANVV